LPRKGFFEKKKKKEKKKEERRRRRRKKTKTNLAPAPREPGQHLPARQHLRRAPFALLGFPELGSG